MEQNNDIRANVAAIREKMAEAARSCGRDPKEIKLCAATKMNDAARVKEAVAAGVDCCGENRVQELLEKQPQGAYEGAPVHFIGHLQTNKVKQVVGRGDLSLVQDILLEVNIGAEESKSGFTPEETMQTAAKMAEYPHCHLKGLMAIPPVSEHEGDNCRYFAEMRNLFVDISAKKYDNVSMECLSMGMSGDYPDAIREGATMIRVGTAIFGARHYSK